MCVWGGGGGGGGGGGPGDEGGGMGVVTRVRRMGMGAERGKIVKLQK